MTVPCILLIDRASDSGNLADHLQAAGYATRSVSETKAAIDEALSGRHVGVLLGTGWAVMSGIDLLRRIRRRSLLPILMHSSGASESERILALESGADDFLPHPFSPRELIARLRAILRRTSLGIGLFNPLYRVAEIELDKMQRTVTRNGEPLVLTATEFDLLAALLTSAGRVVSREELARATLGREWRANDRSIDVHISNLRRKLRRRGDRMERIQTIRGSGYLYATTPDAVNQQYEPRTSKSDGHQTDFTFTYHR